jgi:hypothetical protein
MNDYRSPSRACLLAPRPTAPSARTRAGQGRRPLALSRRTARLATNGGTRRIGTHAYPRVSPSRY